MCTWKPLLMLNGTPASLNVYSIRSSLSLMVALVRQTHRGFALMASVHCCCGGTTTAGRVVAGVVAAGWLEVPSAPGVLLLLLAGLSASATAAPPRASSRT